MIYEFYKKDYRNVGDLCCNPSRYFDLGSVKSQHFKKLNDEIEGNPAIIGGGGLLHKKFMPIFIKLLAQTPSLAVMWGVGHNTSTMTKVQDYEYYPEFIKDFDLVGIRDYIPGKEDLYVPCVSCMHPAFDKKYYSKHETVYFVHATKMRKQQPSQKNMMLNSEMNFDQVIEFLGSGDTVVTNSYHGAYWSMLLGKKVAVLPWSVKFDHFKYQPCKISTWNNIKEIQRAYQVDADYLTECRNLNRNFYEKFLRIVYDV